MRIPPGIQSWFAVLALSLAVFLASTAIGLIGLLSHAVFLVGPGITARDLLAPAAAAVVAIIALIAYLALKLWLELQPRLPYPPLPPLDEIQFTVYRPQAVHPGVWYPLLAFAHLADRRPGAPEGEPDPIELVRAQAGQILGPSRVRRYRETSVDARQPVPREGEITLLPVVPGIEFNPARRTFCWLEDVHREEFSLRAAATADGTTARGRLMVYLGAILLAEIDLTIRVDSADHESAAATHFHADTKRPYRKIFASYSHRDVEIVRQYEALVGSLGDRYLRDVRDLRAGEKWDLRLLGLIEKADIFQLFWSTNSMRSCFVRREWEHALALGRPNFIRPTYWENPLPESPADSLPPDALRRLHFHWVDAALVAPRRRPRRRLSLAQRGALGMSLLLAVSLGYYMTIPPKPREFPPPTASTPGPPLAPTKKVPPPLPPTKEERNDLLGILGRPVVLEDGSLGTQVGQVFPGSPAQRVGLEPGDVIARVDGRPFVSPNDMNLALGRSNGWPVLTVFRVRYGQYVNVITPLN